jgi:hypothetical protein
MAEACGLARINILLSKINKKLWRQKELNWPFEFPWPNLGSLMHNGSLNN